ncbi:histidinol-phosphate transaminase [Convivina intestini]|uniref:histidinol-phosphate transaminase n=1 Tax=Convivina intestini TaxID=1505726 RepID=UPI00200FA249|nr:histidinol-phosphate transaminase [Convivina intestini]CAH1850605.1 Histidinol-phosphate aminotransferase [Convivina intestini]
MKELIKNLAAYQAEEPAELVKKRYGLKELARLSANESVYGPSPLAVQALQAVDPAVLNYYPDGQATALRQAVAQVGKVPLESLIFGDGADELIELLTRTILTPGSEMIVPQPTFGEYAIHAQIEAAKTIQVPIDAQSGQVDFDALLAAVTDQTALIFLANPNNPTGVLEKVADIRAFLDKLPSKVILVVDEAYYEFANNPAATCAPLVEQYDNLVVLRTLSKAYGLANLRVGYGIVPAQLFDILQAVRLPYNLSTYQITGGAAAVADQPYLQKVVQQVSQERQDFEICLTKLGLTFYPSATNFIWVKVGDAESVGQKLLEKGYQINAHLNPAWVRITLGTPTQNRAMQEILGQILAK